MAGKNPTPAKNKKPVSKNTGEKAKENQGVIQGTPVTVGHKKEKTHAAQTRSGKDAVPGEGGLVVEPGTVHRGKGNAIVTVPADEIETRVAAIFANPKPVANAPVQRGQAGALGGRKLRRERGL